MTTTKMMLGFGLVLVAGGATFCSRHSSTETAPASPAASEQAPAAPAAPPAAPVPAVPAPAVPAPAAPVASGPRAEINGEHYSLAAAIEAPPAIPGASTVTVEIHATDGFHMNDLYPSSVVDLGATDATAPAAVRRAEAQEISQQRVAFRVPVQVTGAGASVHGTVRFAVCSAENCFPRTQSFAVALAH
jgi:hypothetical protein